MTRLLSRLIRTMLCVAMAVGAMAERAKAEDVVLLASTVPGYMPGMVISSADRLSVPEGASATLLFQSGDVLRLRGPFEGTLGQPQPGVAAGTAAMVADMFRMRGIDATVIGGTRSTTLARPRSTLEDLEVDPQRSGTYCVEQATSVWITRPATLGTNEADTYALRRKGSSRMLSWPAGAERIEWPVDVPIEDGSQFEITTGGVAQSTLTFRELSSTATTGLARIANGLILGCHEQFDAALKRSGRSVARPEVWITTDHGRRPTYHIGEPIVLTVVANMDGYLYCVAADQDGSDRPIFPAGAVDGAQLLGSVPLSIPGRRQPAGLTAVPGLARVRCWLADRDVTPQLPPALLGAPSTRFPDQLAGGLDDLFAHINGTRIDEDDLTVRTE
ncbi:MAG: DUF4384 domain-containing protein [Rhodopila sp.]|jgi:hypothetical protein